MSGKKIAIIAGIGVGVIAIIIGALYSMYFSGFNAAQAKDENVKRLAADIDAQLQRRYDLIPNLVNSVKGYLQFEKSVLEEVTRLRSQWQAASSTNERVQLSNQIEEALSKIILTYEAYPDLKSDQVVVRLMDELAGTENRIAVARTYFNDGVRDFNTNIRTFPNNMFNESGFLGAKPWGLTQYTPYEASQAATTTVPQVDINLPS
ncbi:MAG: LemA family protein [Nitrososphaera sp.]|nr:LemA family protein [Nitrososphaera sp.]